MKVTLKVPYEAEQFNPRHGVPSCVVDMLRQAALRLYGYEWAVKHLDNELEGIHVGDWIVNNGNENFVLTNEQFHQTFKEVAE
ncbi:hypothetical protein [Latilactobacillus sakei]|uniref:hypothetical protein n=1 Tax=Latilactobacillus sakei TaxID=1599 RepID=UPI001BD6AC85|nr:hypothetical protein [Latilactobacillus sakei]QVQ48515.1 hypothetical protein KIK01_07835 [Latilactobacillus sakei subsp. sakei]